MESTKPSLNSAENGNKSKPLLVAVSLKKRKCYNCKFAGTQFKITNLTHLHCENETIFPKEKWESGELSPWDSLQVFSDTCEFHEFKSSAVK